MKTGDAKTRQRLIDAGTRLFAERGFKRVSVREICCEARANVAAVNYHFGDKLGLYREVVQSAVAAMRSTGEAARRAGERGTAEEKLRAYVRVYVEGVAGHTHDSWIHWLMSHELADPTPALELVIRQVVRPRMAYLGGIVAELMGRRRADPAVVRSVHSIHAQCVVIPSLLASRMFPGVKTSPDALKVLADHIASFSLAGIRAMRHL